MQITQSNHTILAHIPSGGHVMDCENSEHARWVLILSDGEIIRSKYFNDLEGYASGRANLYYTQRALDSLMVFPKDSVEGLGVVADQLVAGAHARADRTVG